jgi:HD-like signal output (HDOD) protein
MIDVDLKQALRNIRMLGKLPPWQFDVIADVAEVLRHKKGQALLRRGDDDGYTYFLGEGSLLLEGADGTVRTLSADDGPQQMPVANLRPRILDVTATSRGWTVRLPDIALTACGCLAPNQGMLDIAVETREESERRDAEARLSFDLYKDLVRDQAILPTLPDLAMRVRRAIEQESATAKSVARLVESDPALAAKLLKAANSAMYGGLNAVESTSSAIVRLGMDATKQLVLSFAMREVFRSEHAGVKRHMQRLWKHSANIAATCFVLARECRGLSSEEALLIGLLHDVGTLAILAYIERYPDLLADEAGIDLTIVRMRGELGAMILRQWRFPAEVIAGARNAENWTRKHTGGGDYTDLIIVAQVHERMRKHDLAGLPPLAEISAMSRVLGEVAGPEKSVQILHEAKDQLDAMHAVLRI